MPLDRDVSRLRDSVSIAICMPAALDSANRRRRFPAGFLWGAATASHQVEGGNRWNDWWEYESSGRLPFASGDCCRHYELYEQDFDLARSLGHNCHRLSLEWSRIEPEDGQWNPAAIEHYARVIRALKARGIEPVVTLQSFHAACLVPAPRWLGMRRQRKNLRPLRGVRGATNRRTGRILADHQRTHGVRSAVLHQWRMAATATQVLAEGGQGAAQPRQSSRRRVRCHKTVATGCDRSVSRTMPCGWSPAIPGDFWIEWRHGFAISHSTGCFLD